jgi:hypothetical protein
VPRAVIKRNCREESESWRGTRPARKELIEVSNECNWGQGPAHAVPITMLSNSNNRSPFHMMGRNRRHERRMRIRSMRLCSYSFQSRH